FLFFPAAPTTQRDTLSYTTLFRSLRQRGAEVISVPAAFTAVTGAAHWEVLIRARAIETQCYLLAAGQGGEHPGPRETHGHSAIRSEEHTSELQSRENLVCRLLLEK